jgi:hypothetical protein
MLPLRLKMCLTWAAKEYKGSLSPGQADGDEREHDDHAQLNVKKDTMETKTQGALLLQSLLHIGEPHNQIVIDR